MHETLRALVTLYGSQARAAAALGVTDRTLRGYFARPVSVPIPMRKLMIATLMAGRDIPAAPSPSLSSPPAENLGEGEGV